MPWKAVSMLWPTIVAALLPLDLATAITRFPRLLGRLAALDARSGHLSNQDRSRPRQVDDFRSRFVSPLRKAA
jgi:hypothetical protein